MKNNQLHFYPFLPRLLFFIVLMVFAYTQVHILVHFFVLCILASFERFILPATIFRTPFRTQVVKMWPVLIFLLLFYAVFLQTGTSVLFEISVGSFHWTVRVEALNYALHYIFLFVETFWVIYLIHHEQKIESIQYFFYGNLFFLTLLWNGSIQQSKKVMLLKDDFDSAIRMRRFTVSRYRYIKLFFQYALGHLIEYIYHQIPSFQRIWRNKDYQRSHSMTRWIWVVPILFLVTAFSRNLIATDQYLKIQTLIAVVGVGMLYLIVSDQYEEMSPETSWQKKDYVALWLLIFWMVVAFYQTDMVFYQPIDAFYAPSSLGVFVYGTMIMLVGVLMLFFGERKHD